MAPRAAKGDRFANRYLSSLVAIEALAAKAGDAETARRARNLAEQTTESLMAWLRRASADELAARVDLPWGRADLNYVTKLALALGAN